MRDQENAALSLKLFGGFLLLCAAFLILLITMVYFYQERIIFFPERLSSGTRFEFKMPFEEGDLVLQDEGVRLNYLMFTPKRAPGTILYFHGNAGSLRDWGKVAAEISERTGWSVWIMDYPGFGKSNSILPKTETILLEMANSFHAEIKNHFPNQPLVIYGRSIGTGIASGLASVHTVAGLILESPYLSLAKLGQELYPVFPKAMNRFDLDNEKSLSKLENLPTLIFHGTRDEVIPFRHGESLGHLSKQFTFVPIEGGGHNNLSESREYWDALREFLDQYKPKKPENRQGERQVRSHNPLN